MTCLPATAWTSAMSSATTEWRFPMSYPKEFAYGTMVRSDGSGRVASVLAFQSPANLPLRAVMWSGRRKAWIYAPAIVAMYLFDEEYMDRTARVDRSTAEETARSVLNTELPAEETLRQMCEEGERLGWSAGPARS